MASCILIIAGLLTFLLPGTLGCASQEGTAWNIHEKGKNARTDGTLAWGFDETNSPVLSLPETVTLADMFHFFDTNKDGQITLVEWTILYASMTSTFDANGDGHLSLEELQANSNIPSSGTGELFVPVASQPDPAPSHVEVQPPPRQRSAEQVSSEVRSEVAPKPKKSRKNKKNRRQRL